MIHTFIKIKFEGADIRALKSDSEAIVWLCLNDLLKVLGRSEMIENGAVVKICKGVTRHPFKDGGRNRWAIKPFEVTTLLRRISPENGMVAKLCERMQLWVDELPIGMVNEAKLLPIQPLHNKSIIYNYQDQFPITFKAGREKTYINATQMAKSFDKSPHVWLSSASTQEFREAMVARGESESLDNQVFSTRGRMGATWIEENLAIEFARWLSPDFSAWCNAKVKELVNDSCHHSYPYPQQRHKSESSKKNFTVPQTFDEALQLAANQARQIREDEHKVSFYDQLVEMRESFKSTRIADELETSAFSLHRFLAEEGIVTFNKKRKCWVVNGPYRPLQCDVPYMLQREDGKVYPFGSVKRWTPAGREYIIELWNTKRGSYERV